MSRLTMAAILLLISLFAPTVFAASQSSESDTAGVGARATTELDLIGISTVQYNDISDNTARIKQVEVRNNRPSGVSSTLSIQLWAFSQPFLGGNGQLGYKMAEATLGTLAAGSSFKGIDQSVAGLAIPPDGTYYTSFLLVEKVSGQEAFYDYVNFAGQVVYTQGLVNVIAPPGFFKTSGSSTAKQGAPFSFTFPDAVGALPITYSASGLPPGLVLKNTTISIDESGQISPLMSGTPTKDGPYTVVLTASNSDGSASFTLSLTIAKNGVNASPTILSLSATPNPAVTGQRVNFSATANDPENATLTYSWDFADGTTLPGATVSHTFSTPGTYNVTLSVSDGTTTVQQTMSVEVTGSATSDPFIDIVTASDNPVLINTTATLTATAFSPAGEALTYTWNFGDGTPTQTGNPVTHAYAAKGEYTVSVTVQDVSLRLGSFSDFTMFVVDGTDTQNLVGGLPSISPDGVQITVAPSPPGLLALNLALVDPRDVANRANFSFNTDFMVPGRNTVPVGGDKPVNRMNRSGVVVATTTATDTTDTSSRRRGRKTIPIGARDLGEVPAVPDTLTDGQKVISTTKVAGTFNFTSDKADKVKATFKIPLPAGYDLLRSQEISIGLSNIADRIVLDAKGKATGLADRGVLQKIKVKYPRSTGGLTTEGQFALVDATFAGPNLDQAGFESDGIVATTGGARSLQVAIVLAGIPYSGTIDVDYKLSTKKDKGGIKLKK